MSGPQKVYDIDLDQLPGYDELVRRLEAAGVAPQAARQAAGWAELQRAGVDPGVSYRSEVRYRRALCAAMGVPVPPRPGRAYADKAEPLRDAGAAELVGVGLALAGAGAAMASVHQLGAVALLALAPIMEDRPGYVELAAA